MENIFNNIVDISKSAIVVNNNNTKIELDIVNQPDIEKQCEEEDILKIKKVITSQLNNDNLSQNVININMLLSNNADNNSSNIEFSSNTKKSRYEDLTKIMTHINELNEKIIYYNALSKLKENENQQLLNENKSLRTNLILIKRRFNLR